jgi:hypothetical protein
LWKARRQIQTNDLLFAYSDLRRQGARQGMKVGLTSAVASVTRPRDGLTQVM